MQRAGEKARMLSIISVRRMSPRSTMATWTPGIAAFTNDGVQMRPNAPGNLDSESSWAWSQASFQRLHLDGATAIAPCVHVPFGMRNAEPSSARSGHTDPTNMVLLKHRTRATAPVTTATSVGPLHEEAPLHGPSVSGGG